MLYKRSAFLKHKILPSSTLKGIRCFQNVSIPSTSLPTIVTCSIRQSWLVSHTGGIFDGSSVVIVVIGVVAVTASQRETWSFAATFVVNRLQLVKSSNGVARSRFHGFPVIGGRKPEAEIGRCPSGSALPFGIKRAQVGYAKHFFFQRQLFTEELFLYVELVSLAS